MKLVHPNQDTEMEQKHVKELEQYYLPSTLNTKTSLLCYVTSDIILSFLFALPS